MSINPGLMSSLRGDWETPSEIFDPLNAEFNFALDVCATEATAKCPAYFTAEHDALTRMWGGPAYMNPPYGREIGKWVKKAYYTALGGNTVVCLLPARTDTAWWHDYCMKGEVRFLRGRIKFLQDGERLGPAPFPSAIVIFQGKQ